MPVLSVDNITVSFDSRRVLDGISFTVNQGDKIAFIGNNGAGKSTLFKAVKGVMIPDDGKVLLHGNTTLGFLSQNMDEQDLSSDTLKPSHMTEVEDEMKRIEFELQTDSSKEKLDEYAKVSARYEAMGGYDYEFRIKEALAGLGLKEIDARTDLMTLSGGEKMRVCLARLIVERPDILMLDEPTNHLDADAIEWLEDYLKSYKGSVFVISHDRHFIDAFANRVIELDGGHITQYKGNYDSYKQQKEEFLKTQKRVVEALEKELEHQLDVKQTMLSHRNISGYHQREKMVDKLSSVLERERARLPSGEGHMNFTVVPSDRDGASDKIMIAVKGVSKSFGDGPVIFEDINFELKAGEKLFLAGPNGCGKSTLLSILRGKVAGLDGSVFISAAATIGFMEQFVPFEDENATCYDELIRRSDLTVTEARSMLARFGFRADEVFKTISVLSGGERSRLYLCCILEENPDILFLDEPTNHLDIESREILEDALKEYSGAIICVSHDRFFIEKCADRVLGFADGTAKLYDTYEYYRKAVRKASLQEPVKEEVPAKKNEDKPKINQAMQRKLNAQRAQRIRELEKLIEEKEQEQKALEEKFLTPEATKEDYDTYACNASVIEKMYDEYESLC
ncbi:MAG: ABC-F family ATP-binding cassette domain-containing protein [Clostridiales bacterium]|nr:ABC-F family ATP-binding cassette domain-containing protein [Clostridiales bacterium]